MWYAVQFFVCMCDFTMENLSMYIIIS